ncbi:dynein axonemal assembly factor 4-like [Euwallacea fornicatus]|uniref:dynein axonemal assembly factor 4-like n=1 Tax=Euwallacea fornicatus TaxID=995702 RepID=UPI0033905BEF
MPIIVKDFIWKQSLNKVILCVPLHNVPSCKVDVFTSPQYLKLTFETFFFEAILLKAINVSQSICTKTWKYVIFDLQKECEEMWDSLEVQGLTKEEKMKLKIRLIDEEHQRVQNKFQEKLNLKAELKRVAVNEQIKLDTRVRGKIEEIKKRAEKDALGDLNAWKEEVELKPNSDKIVEIAEDNNEQYGVAIMRSAQQTNKPKLRLYRESKKLDPIPKSRNIQSLQILFTPREFPTPSRESRLEEENEFLIKQAEARKSTGFYDKDLRPEEKNPQYLLAKAKEFKKHQNYLGAISALSFAIKLSPQFVDLYFERSEVHILVGNFSRAVDDCSKALSLYKPLCEVNLHERAVCIGRRGIALFKLGLLQQGISELQASIKLESNEEFRIALEGYEKELEEVKTKNNGKV